LIGPRAIAMIGEEERVAMKEGNPNFKKARACLIMQGRQLDLPGQRVAKNS